MKWCCKAFEISFRTAGAKGFAVFVATRDSAGPAFILQHRSFDWGTAVPRTDWPLTLFADVQIHFCPWCGANLSRFYKGSIGELDRSDLKIAD